MRIQLTFCLVALCVLAVSAKKRHDAELNEESLVTESREHGVKKYGKDQKSHHHEKHGKAGHEHHKKHQLPVEEEIIVEEPVAKSEPHGVPEAEAKLQSNLETSRKAVHDQQTKDQTEDLHLQDLTYEENLKKEQTKKEEKHQHKKGGHKKHHHKSDKEAVASEEEKLFAEKEVKNVAQEKVLEDSFEALHEAPVEEQKNKHKENGKKSKSKNKKAHEKSKDKQNKKKSKDSTKKNKDKKQKNKDKKW